MDLIKSKLTDETYHRDTTRISKSGLDLINQSPAHYYDKYLNPDPYYPPIKKDEKHFDIGSVFHCAMLEPNEFFKRYIVTTKKVDRRTTKGKWEWNEFIRSANGRKIINADVYEWAMRMQESAMKNPIVKKLFERGYAERICEFIEPTTGASCKCRPDWETVDNILVDLKSTDDASINGFEKSVRKFRYYVQDPFYRDGLDAERGIFPELFIFVAVEKKPPFGVGLFTVDQDDINRGRDVYIKNIERWLECRKTGVWPGYPTEIQSLKLRYFNDL